MIHGENKKTITQVFRFHQKYMYNKSIARRSIIYPKVFFVSKDEAFVRHGNKLFIL
jgi:hypothetical protein